MSRKRKTKNRNRAKGSRAAVAAKISQTAVPDSGVMVSTSEGAVSTSAAAKEAVPDGSELVIREVELGGAKGDEDAAEDTTVDDSGEGSGESAGDEVATREKAATEKTEVAKGGRLHKLNIYYPWLKFVAAIVVVAGLVFGGIQAGRMIGGVEQGDEGESGQVAGGSDGDGDSEGGDVGNGDTGDVEEKPKEEEKPAEEQPKEPEKPATTTNPPAAVPATGGKKLVALTFDDGPSTLTTARLLDILKAKGVKATFFVVGTMASRAPDLLKREVAEGHEVGSHSTYHQDLSKLSAVDLQADVANMDRIFTEALGRNAGIVRPPYGAVSDIMRGYLGKPMIYWSVDPMDWKYRDAATVRANVVGATFDGAVVLMHDIHASTVDAVAGIIDDLRAQGYEFLTVSELAAARGVGLTSGVVYYNFKP